MTTPTPWRAEAERQAAAIAAQGRWRTVRALDGGSVGGRLADGEPGGRAVVHFASNDYLGLTQHPAVRAAAHDALDRWGAGSGASRLVVGSRPVHHDLEIALAAWKGTDAALLFPTGFAANLGVLTAFGSAETCIYSDELNHASIIDGARLARADVAVYRHRDVEHLADLLRADRRHRRALVVTDLVFSMDGDLAPVHELAEMCANHGALLVVDEAHAVLGPELDDLPAELDVLRVGTLSKALGSLGGFVAGPQVFVDLLVNTARPFIFTTAPTPADTAAAMAALAVFRSTEGEQLRQRLRANIHQLAPDWPTPILPVVVGGEREALAASAALLERGILVPAIRPPTVAPGTSRLRVALSAAHDPADVDRLAEALTALDLHPGAVPA
jgi:8-amino-7-oxononanoate synthase